MSFLKQLLLSEQTLEKGRSSRTSSRKSSVNSVEQVKLKNNYLVKMEDDISVSNRNGENHLIILLSFYVGYSYYLYKFHSIYSSALVVLKNTNYWFFKVLHQGASLFW